VTVEHQDHDFLPCGLEYGVAPLPRRHIVTFEIRVLAGAACEPEDKLGLARLVVETIDKSSRHRTGRELSDAFDAIGASRRCGSGRETTTFACTVLPEHFEQAVALHAELLREPTFPADVFEANVELARQELLALEDDAQSLADKLLSRRAYGPLLGRHPLGESETLSRITRMDLEQYWRRFFGAGRVVAAVAGAIEPHRVADILQRQFTGFGSSERLGREPYTLSFSPGTEHHPKELEQEQIGICWPGVGVTHDDFPTQQVMLGILSGGMSARLFTEVREKQGLVYWVNAWQEAPRGAGMIFLGASTTPDRCDRTFETLLSEVDRLAETIESEELERAVTGILAQLETRGDTTRSRCTELLNDLFFFGRPIPEEEKIAKVKAVTIDAIRGYLKTYPRDRLCVVTLGPRPIDAHAGWRPMAARAAS
jgi:predicted Zn-dependent peptidase